MLVSPLEFRLRNVPVNPVQETSSVPLTEHPDGTAAVTGVHTTASITSARMLRDHVQQGMVFTGATVVWRHLETLGE